MHALKLAKVFWTYSLTLWKILQYKLHFKASHWYPSKLTDFNRYFDEDSALFSSKNLVKEKRI